MNGNVYLTGFMGAGKTAVGRLLARLLRRRFVDMDPVLVRRFRRPIPRVFDQLGEDVFRRAETELLEELAGQSRLVVATGGGVVQNARNRDLMKASGRTVFLKADFDTCLARLGPEEVGDRPMWRDPEAARKLYDRRRGLYAGADETVRVDGLTPDEAAEDIAGRLMPDHAFSVHLDGRDHPVVVTRRGPEELGSRAGGRKCLVLTDRRVANRHLDRYTAVLDDPTILVLPGGERIKTLRTAEKTYRVLMDGRFNRDDLLAAVGGGAVTDLGAFVAGTFKRGMDFLLVSTSLLGCVDAAVGGKAAVNLGGAKNAVGAFTVPKCVILDAAALDTLPTERIREGLIEAYKTGLAASPPLARLIEDRADALLAKDAPHLFQAVALSARAKTGVVSADFRERGRRAILNLGHTYGHAVESWHGYKVGHGRAVAAGMLVAAGLSEARGLLPPAAADRIVGVVRRIMPNDVALPPARDAWKIMAHDKKIRGGKIVFVLLEGEGRPVIVDDVSPAELAGALKRLGRGGTADREKKG